MTAVNIIVFLLTFTIMEFMAWTIYKYVVQGFLLGLHIEHHKKDQDFWF